MGNVLTIGSALGGAIVFVTSILTIIRGIFNQVNATKENTAALTRLSKQIEEMDGSLNQHGNQLANHEARITVLERK